MRTLVLVTLLAACTAEGPKQKEEVTVEDVLYSPSQSGTGLTMNGDVHVFNTETVYAIVFKCKHGRFVVRGEDGIAKKLWQSVRKGERMNATFAERFKDGQVVGYTFYDAEEAK